MRHAIHRTLLAAVLSVGLTASAWAGWDEVLADALATLGEAAGPDAVADAQIVIGHLHYNGLGVPKDFTEAMKWYRKAAELGDAKAQYQVGVMFRHGQGVAKLPAEALMWGQKAAEQGYAKAQIEMASITLERGGYTSQARAKAAKWYRMAAEQGDVEAQNSLGQLYYNGDGVPQDLVQAHLWFSLVMMQKDTDPRAQGDDTAEINRKFAAGTLTEQEAVKQWLESRVSMYTHAESTIILVESFMTAEEIAEAQRLAREWLEKHGQ